MLRIRGALLPAMLAASFSASAAAPDTEAVEFYNAFINHYFVTATATEAQALESGAAGPGWLRTGRSYPAWLDKSSAPADAQPVCRFYSTGANSHFYTASANECAGLRQLEATERAAGGAVKGWQYEGIAFYIQAPSGGQCSGGTVTITRAYNNGFATGEGSNHRFIDDNELQALMVDRSWIAEGAVMCSQPKSATGTNANLAATTASFGSLEATWTGDAKWKSENNGRETRATAPLTLTIDAAGAVSGSGNGCTFTGQVKAGDGFRSLFKATVSATGCTVASFNGDYQFAHFERFGTGTLMVNMKREAGPVEAKIEARLTTDTTVIAQPNAADFSSVAGDWTGTVGWIAKQEGSGKDSSHRNEVNRPLSLSITSGGALSGSGFGCTLTGTLSSNKSGQSGFGGTVTTTGCENAAFDGTFNDVRVKREDAGSIEVDFKQETRSGNTKNIVEIEGELDAAGATPPPQPPMAPASTVIGSWEGNVTFLATARTTGGVVTPVRIDREQLQLQIAADGTVTGSGLGCTFTGTLTFSDSQRHVSGGTITATGCSNALFDGVYNHIEMQLEDGRALEIQIRRKNEKDDGEDDNTGTVKIFGALSRAAA